MINSNSMLDTTNILEGVNKMPSTSYKLICGLFRMIGINKKLKQDEENLKKFIDSYITKQDNIKIPTEKIKKNYDFEKRVIGTTDCYITKQKNNSPKKALLYIFGGGYFIPCDPGDFSFAGQFADNTNREVWFPIYPLAPRYKLIDSIKSVLSVYQEMLKKYAPEDITFFGTSSGGGLCLSLLMYIKENKMNIPMPKHLVLQSPGLQVPPSKEQLEKMREIEDKDVMIAPDFFFVIDKILTDEKDAYLLSPILYDLSGFPSMDIIYGSYEVMYAYLPDMIKHCGECGVKIVPHVGEEMMHCWLAMEMTPEGKKARQDVFDMINNS